MNEKELKEQIKEAYTEFEGFTGCQQADAILVLTVAVCLGCTRIADRLSDIESALDSISANLPS
jgi:hypothetical protein